jgi:DNA-binding transcriptional MerR regulator
MDSVLLTTQQLAQRLGLASITLQFWRAQGIGIPFVKVGHRVFYRLADVQRYERREMRALTTWLLATDNPLPEMRAMVRAAGLPLQAIRPHCRNLYRLRGDDDFASPHADMVWQPFDGDLRTSQPPATTTASSPSIPHELA